MKRHVSVGWVCLLGAGLMALLLGCQRGPLPEEQLDRPGDLKLDLGEGVLMRLVPIEAVDLMVSKYEISNRLYRRFKPDHNSGLHKAFDLNADDQPAVNISWQEARQFCAWLSERHGVSDGQRYRFRLPKEEEWETFARCGTARAYPWGDDYPPPKKKRWNYFGAENKMDPSQKLSLDDGHPVSCPVRLSGTNEWRLFGVGGNVWEWCEDVYDGGKSHAARGASWANYENMFLAVGKNKIYAADYRSASLGFRVVAEVSEASDEERRAFEAALKQKADGARAAAQQKQEEAARLAAEAKEKADQERRAQQTAARDEILQLTAAKRFEEVLARVEGYEQRFGKDELSAQWRAAAQKARVYDLGEGVTLELTVIEPLKLAAGQYEVTNKQFKRFKADHESGVFKEHALNGDEQPAVQVTWDDAQAFCRWLNERLAAQLAAGQAFRLPTESEWEALAACGKTRDFPWGSEWPPAAGNTGAIEDYDDGAAVSCPVAESGKNEWGVYGLAGNVWEWCAGWYDEGQGLRPMRGGAWNLAKPDAFKIANRNGDKPDQRNAYIGFRVVLDLAGAAAPSP